MTCIAVNTNTIDIALNGACDTDIIHHCQPLFISIEGPAVHDGTNMRCTEIGCRFPDNARFNILTENLECFSGVGTAIASMLLVIASIFATVRF